MYKRFRDGLFDPKKVIDYIGDKIIISILMIILYAIIMLIPDVINTINYSLDYDTKSAYTQEFKNEYIPFKIINGELTCYDNEYNETYTKTVNGLKYVISNDFNQTNLYDTVVVLSKEKVTVYISAFAIDIFNYIDYEDLNNLDLNTLTNGQNESWDTLFKTMNNVYKNYRPLTVSITIILGLFSNLSVIMFVVMLFSLSGLVRLRKIINFGAIFKMNVYYITPFIICELLDVIFKINFLYIIGIIITIIYTNIGQIEIIKRVYNTHAEE